jgi:hypothetical protein
VVKNKNGNASTDSEKAETVPEDQDGGVLDQLGLQDAASEDPLFKFLSSYWRPIAVIVIAVFGANYIYEAFQETYEARMRRAADVYLNLQQEYSRLKELERDLDLMPDQVAAEEVEAKADEAAKKEEDRAKLLEKRNEHIKNINDYLAALETEREPYNLIGDLYANLSKSPSDEKVVDPAVASLAVTEQSLEELDANRLIKELKAFALWRRQLDNDEQREKAVAGLEELARNGVFVNLASALTLINLSENDDKKQELVSLLQGIVEKTPEQRSLIEEVAPGLIE